VDGSSILVDSRPKSVGLVWGLAATWCWVCTQQMNQVNSRNGFGHDGSTIIIVLVLLLLILQWPNVFPVAKIKIKWHISFIGGKCPSRYPINNALKGNQSNKNCPLISSFPDVMPDSWGKWHRIWHQYPMNRHTLAKKTRNKKPTLRWAQLVLGWMMVFRQANHLGK